MITPGAADPGDDDLVRPVQRREPRLGQRGQRGAVARETPAPLRNVPPCTVTKLGQNPSTQEKSLLHEDWSMARLRPKSVSSGTMATQFDFTPQSPHPSHTAGLMNARRGGSGNFPRLRLRRFSAAQVWS